MRIIAVIQARLNSTRLPKKVLATIGNLTVIEHVVRRVAKSRVAETVVAVPLADAAIIGDAVGTGNLRTSVYGWDGPENDVLGRFASVASIWQADAVVRITADCPFIQVDAINSVAGMIARLEHQRASNIDPARTYPDGLDVEAFLTSELLRWDRECQDAAHREHVTSYSRSLGESWRGLLLSKNRSRHRWTLDTLGDLAWFWRVAEAIDVTPPGPSMETLLELIARKPELAHFQSEAA